MENKIIHFELNNWSAVDFYPNAEPFLTWIGNDLNIKLNDEKWVKDNKLCIVKHIVDMSINFLVTATKEWVENNCPELLTKYKKFIRYPEKDGDVYGQFGYKFSKYSDENIGIVFIEEDD